MKLSFKKLFKNAFLILTFLFSVLSLIAYFYDKNLFFEIVVSFQPYNLLISLVLSFIFLLILIVNVIYIKKNKERVGNHIRNYLFSLVNFLLLITLFGLTFSQIYKFSYQKHDYSSALEQNQNQNKVKVGFYNKFFYNERYSDITKRLDELNLDILGLGELKQEQKDKIDGLKSFKYSLSKKCDECEYKEDVALYSKYPILESKIFTFGRARIIEANIKINDEEVKVFVIHTTAPANINRFESRNDEMQKLPKLINDSKGKYKILVGDFNASPWTSAMENFEKDLNSIHNISRGEGLKFTWGIGLLKTHLDHIFISNNISAISFNVEDYYGSDHKMIWSEVGI